MRHIILTLVAFLITAPIFADPPPQKMMPSPKVFTPAFKVIGHLKTVYVVMAMRCDTGKWVEIATYDNKEYAQQRATWILIHLVEYCNAKVDTRLVYVPATPIVPYTRVAATICGRSSAIDLRR